MSDAPTGVGNFFPRSDMVTATAQLRSVEVVPAVSMSMAMLWTVIADKCVEAWD